MDVTVTVTSILTYNITSTCPPKKPIFSRERRFLKRRFLKSLQKVAKKVSSGKFSEWAWMHSAAAAHPWVS